MACESDNGGGITTGGGFSNVNTVQSWQATQVTNYFKSVVNTAKQPVRGYSVNGRGYPDISVAGSKYLVAVNGELVPVSGTSASAPVVAGIISLANAVRAAAGQPTLGFLNPFLYSKSSLFVRDILSGDNLCTSSETVCCTQGFHTAPGW